MIANIFSGKAPRMIWRNGKYILQLFSTFVGRDSNNNDSFPIFPRLVIPNEPQVFLSFLLCKDKEASQHRRRRGNFSPAEYGKDRQGISRDLQTTNFIDEIFPACSFTLPTQRDQFVVYIIWQNPSQELGPTLCH